MVYARKASTRKGARVSRRKPARRIAKRPTRRAGVRRTRAVKRSGRKIRTMTAGPFYNSDRAHVKLRFCEPPYIVSCPALVSAPHVDQYAINGIYDPALGVGGSSCSGYTLMTSQYGYSLVKGARITVNVRRAVDTDQNSPFDGFVCPITSEGSASPPTSLATWQEQPYCIRIRGTSIGSDKGHTVHQYMSVAKIQGLKDIYAPSYRAASGANPVTMPRWYVGFINGDPGIAADQVSLVVTVSITYYVEFFERYSNPGSFIDKALKAAKEAGILQKLYDENHRSTPYPILPKKRLDCDHKECKCEIKSESEPEDSDLDEEFDDLPAGVPVVSPLDQPAIPKELPPKALETPGSVPDRAPTSAPPGGVVARRVRLVEASQDRPKSTQVVRKS